MSRTYDGFPFQTKIIFEKKFPSKRKIFSGLVDFCEQSILELISDVNSSDDDALNKVENILLILVSFSEKNPGIARLLTREAFSVEQAALEERIRQLFSKIELQIKQHLQKHEQISKKKLALTTAASANLLLAFSEGLIQQFVRSGFQEKPTQRIKDQLGFLIQNLSGF